MKKIGLWLIAIYFTIALYGAVRDNLLTDKIIDRLFEQHYLVAGLICFGIIVGSLLVSWPIVNWLDSGNSKRG